MRAPLARSCFALAAAFSLSSVGCGESGDDAMADAGPVVPPAEARVEIGTGSATFVALADGDPIELVYGAQGGWHVDTAVRLWGMEPEGMLLTYEVRREGTDALINLAAQYGVHRSRVVVEGDHFVRVGDRAQLDIMDPVEVVGARVELSAIAAPASGGSVRDARLVVIVDER